MLIQNVWSLDETLFNISLYTLQQKHPLYV